MKNEAFKKQLIHALKIEGLDSQVQDDLLVQLEDVAYARVGNSLPELLSPEQMRHIESMHKAKKSEREIIEWIQAQLPDFDQMMQAIMLDVVEELGDYTKLVR